MRDRALSCLVHAARCTGVSAASLPHWAAATWAVTRCWRAPQVREGINRCESAVACASRRHIGAKTRKSDPGLAHIGRHVAAKCASAARPARRHGSASTHTDVAHNHACACCLLPLYGSYFVVHFVVPVAGCMNLVCCTALARGSPDLPAALAPVYINSQLCIVYDNNPSAGDYFVPYVLTRPSAESSRRQRLTAACRLHPSHLASPLCCLRRSL